MGDLDVSLTSFAFDYRPDTSVLREQPIQMVDALVLQAERAMPNASAMWGAALGSSRAPAPRRMPRALLEVVARNRAVGEPNVQAFELGRVYRNEGVSPRHNPEFTMLEAYEAYGDYVTMMDLTEASSRDAAKVAGTPPVVQWMGHEVDLAKPFEQIGRASCRERV